MNQNELLLETERLVSMANKLLNLQKQWDAAADEEKAQIGGSIRSLLLPLDLTVAKLKHLHNEESPFDPTNPG